MSAYHAATEPLRLRIGVAPVELHCTSARVLAAYADLYAPWCVDPCRLRSIDDSSATPETAIRVTVDRQPIRPWRRSRFRVWIGDRLLFQPAGLRELLPYIEWAITWDVPRVLPQYLQLHAASVERNGAGVVLAGVSGSGKSTLAAGLIAGGWRYLCDEFALIHADSLELHPYPRAICIKEPAFAVLQHLRIRDDAMHHGLAGPKGAVRLVRPERIRPDAVGGPCPIRYFIFPTYRPGATPALVPLPRPDAVALLHTVCFNLLKCRRLGLDVLTEAVREAVCYRLVAGEIHATCHLLERLVAGQPAALARAS